MSRSRRSQGFQAAMILLAGFAGIAAAQPLPDAAPSEPSPGRTALVVEIKDAIGPATREFFVRALERAEEQDAELLILVLDTPGGLSESMRDMIRAILSAKVPVVTYVSPPGAHAASAGTFILYASHVAAMAPATNLGAATPVPIGGAPPRDRDAGPDDDKDGSRDAGQEPPAMDRKAINDAVAYIRSIAEMRGRDPSFAEESVTKAASITANEALKRGVIDLIAADLQELIASLDGREVTLPTGRIALATRGITVERIEMDWRTSLLAVLTNPLVAYGLLIIGIYGLMFEGYNPGTLVPGVVGGVCLLLGLYALQVLSVNFAGLALIVLGIAMMAAEFFLPSFGVLGFGGIAAFVIGSIVLMDTDAPGVMASRGLVGGIATVAGAAMLATIAMAMRSRRRPVVTGREQMVGGFAEALADFSGQGTVRIFGETWNAVSATAVTAGQRLRIDRVEGLTLYVSPAE
ncbi:MAG TPA: nodulation protein NfeD [Steroidobacteraceae bacterium]|nr:nodulation protein NfeD [Steroidobacteraceae bacterium]